MLREAVRAYKLTGIPGTFFIDRGGVIRALYPGAMTRQMMLDRLKTILSAAEVWSRCTVFAAVTVRDGSQEMDRCAIK